MDMEQNYDQLLRRAQSPAGQQLLALLQQTGGQQLNQLLEKASKGDMDQVKQQLSALLNSPQAQKLVRELGETP